MYKQQRAQLCQQTMKAPRTATKGETIEQKVRRITVNKEPITDGAPQIYTDRKDGVQAQYNIKTDRWEIAVDAMSYIDKSHKARREERLGERTYDTMTPEEQAKFNTKFPNNKHNKKQTNPETGASSSDQS